MKMNFSNSEEVIRMLEQSIKNLHDDMNAKEKKLATIKDKANFYIQMQRKILADRDIHREWECFIILMKLTLDRSIKGLTEPSTPESNNRSNTNWFSNAYSGLRGKL